MMRILLILLAVLVAVLSFVLDQVWLNWAAGAMIIVALGAVASHLWQQYSETKQYQRKDDASKEREDELRELGIMDVRPQRAESSDEGGDASETPDASAEAPASSPHSAERGAQPSGEPSPSSAASAATKTPASETVSEPPESSQPTSEGASSSSEDEAESSALGPYLEALRRAVEARTVCLLVQEEMALTYRIAAIQSASADIRAAETTFETDEPLLTASMSRQAVTVRSVGSDDVPPEALGYYTDAAALAHVAVAPVSRSGPATYFLCVDAGADVSLDLRQARALIARFADGVDALIEVEDTPPEPAPTEAEAAPAEEQDSADDEAAPRPRREIIAEEMEAVHQRDGALSLALVHLNRAESLARTGDVAAAEQQLRTRLQQSAPDGRVERFGELTFGVFYYGDASEVEPWAERLQAQMAREDGLLEGGVSIGVAVWSDQAPEALREDATEALRVSYETGDCTIIE